MMVNAALTGRDDQGEELVSSACSRSTEVLKNPLGWKVVLFQAGEKSQCSGTPSGTVIKSICYWFLHFSSGH